MSEVFQVRKELKIGKIIEVSGNNIRIEIDHDVNELIRAVDGQVYPVGQMGSIIKVHFGRILLFAFVRSLKMRSELAVDDARISISGADDARILEADLFGQGSWSVKNARLEFTRGVESYPLPLQSVYICLNEELEAVYKAAESSTQDEVSPLVPIGHYVNGNNAICRANIDKLFGHHFAILGSTGSGKSATVASILHSVLDHKANEKKLSPRIIMIDPHGEYACAFGDRAKVYRAYNDASFTADQAQLLKLPYWLMSSDELRSLIIGKTEHEATAQNNIIYEAVEYSRLVEAGLVQSLGDDPSGGEEPKLKDGTTEADVLNFDRDKPIPFKLAQFIKHIDKVQGRKLGKPENHSPSSTERQRVESILKKVKVLRANPQLNFLLTEYDESSSPNLQGVLNQFVGDAEGKDIRIIDISGLPNEVAGPLTALIARLLFQYKLWQTRDEREKDPILFVCEEAHRYVPNHGEAQYKEAQVAIRRIAKEGRKYGLGLGLVSQRPSDVESTVLSQCNSWIVLRLTNSSDQEHVAKFLPDSLNGLTKLLSALTRREAIFVGEAAALPSRIKIRKIPQNQLPNSNDIKFAKGWSDEALSEESMNVILARWCGRGQRL